VLIERFEMRYELGHAEPLEALKSLMEDRGLRQRDLISIFGSSSVASDVLTRHLSEFFSVPVGIFI
jgi:HTH-type transcriptional regulator/antitoxin HigA